MTAGLPGPWWNCWGALRILPEGVGLGGQAVPLTVVGLPGEGWGGKQAARQSRNTVSTGGTQSLPGSWGDCWPGTWGSAPVLRVFPGLPVVSPPLWALVGRTLAWCMVSDGRCSVSMSLLMLGERLVGTAHGRLPSGVQVLTARPASRWTWRELLLKCGQPSWGGGRSWVARWLSSQQTPVQPGRSPVSSGCPPSLWLTAEPRSCPAPRVSPLSLALPWPAPRKGGGGRRPGAADQAVALHAPLCACSSRHLLASAPWAWAPSPVIPCVAPAGDGPGWTKAFIKMVTQIKKRKVMTP